MTVERAPRATTAQPCSKGLILLKKQTDYLSKTLILRAYETGTFCIDCTGTPILVATDATPYGAGPPFSACHHQGTRRLSRSIVARSAVKGTTGDTGSGK